MYQKEQTWPLLLYLPGGIDFFFFSLKLFSSRKQYASLTDNVLHFWESSVGPFFSLPPAQSFVLKTPKCNEVTWSKHDAVFQNNKAFWRWIQITYWCVLYRPDLYVTGIQPVHIITISNNTQIYIYILKYSWKREKVISLIGNAKSIVCSLHKLSQLMFCTTIGIFIKKFIQCFIQGIFLTEVFDISEVFAISMSSVFFFFFLLLLLSSPICVNRLGWTFTSGNSIIYLYSSDTAFQ